MSAQVIERVGVQTLQHLCDILERHAVFPEVDYVDATEDEEELKQQEEILDVEGSADETPTETLVLQFKQSYHFTYIL